MNRLLLLLAFACVSSPALAQSGWPSIVPSLLRFVVLKSGGLTAEIDGQAVTFSSLIDKQIRAIEVRSAATDAAFASLRLDPALSPRTPTGWTASGTAGADPVPPSTTSATPTYTCANGVWGSTTGASEAAACGALAALGQSSYGTTCTVAFTGSTSGGTVANFTLTTTGSPSCPSSSATGTISISYACETGYTVSGSSCTLTSAPSVAFPPDSVCGLKISGGLWTYDSRDPDCSGTLPPGVVKSGDSKKFTVQNAMQKIELDLGSGSPQVTIWTPSTTSTSGGSIPTVMDSGYIAGPSATVPGAVVGSSSGSVNSSGSQAFSASPTSTVTNNSTATGFPDDYNREVTQQAISTKLSQLHTDLTSTSGSEPSDPTPKTGTQISDAFFPSTFSGLTSWTFPSRSVTCPTWSFSAFSTTYTIDAHCTLIETVRSLMSTIMLLAWALVALFIVLGA